MNKKQNFENSESRILIKNFLRDVAVFEYEYNPPSALAQEKRYEQYGIKLPFKIFYQYKMPFGLEDSYDLLYWLGCIGVSKTLSDKEAVGLFKVNFDDLSEKDKKRLALLKKYSSAQINKVIEWMRSIGADEMIAEIKKLNPELVNIKIDGKQSAVSNPLQDFVSGVAYGFAPEDIEFCLTHTHDEMQEIAKDPRRLRLRHGHHPAPSRLDALIVAEKRAKYIERVRKNKGHE